VPRHPTVRYSKDYELDDVAYVFRQQPGNTWHEVVYWLKARGLHLMELAPGELARMVADFSVLDAEGQPFTSDPGAAYELAQHHRQGNAVLAALAWVEQAQSMIQATPASAHSDT
jgi:hypothetical protein